MILFLFKRRKQVKFFLRSRKNCWIIWSETGFTIWIFQNHGAVGVRKRKKFICRADMKKFVFTFIFVLAFVGFAAATVSAESPVKPVIEGQIPNCRWMLAGVKRKRCARCRMAFRRRRRNKAYRLACREKNLLSCQAAYHEPCRAREYAEGNRPVLEWNKMKLTELE